MSLQREQPNRYKRENKERYFFTSSVYIV